LNRIGSSALALALAGSALAVGTVHTATLCVVTFVLATAMALTWWDAEPTKVRPAATILALTAVALIAFTLFQCLPLPSRLLAVMAPHNADVWARALAPLKEAGPSWPVLSLDPPATRIELLKGVAYLLAFLTVVKIARQRDGLRFVGGVIVVTGIILATAALLHPAFGAHKLFGVYKPGQAGARHIAPFMNPNNLAGYLNIALCLAFAAALASEPAVPRAISAAIVIFIGATQIWVASRGGVTAMVLGMLVVVAIERLTRSRPRRSVALLSLLTGVAAGLGAAMIVLGGSEDASNELLDTDTSKLRMFGHAMRMFPAVPIFGCGRGAFESAFPAFRIDPGYVTFVYPENWIAQWILEWGLPAGLLGFGAIAFALRPGAVLARSTTASGAWAGIVAVAVQNLGDLGSEVPGLVLAGAACAGMVVAGTPGHRPRWWIERWSLAPRAVAACGIAAAALAIVAGAAGMGLGWEVTEDRLTLQHAVLEERLPVESAHALAKAAMLRHPGEPYLPFVMALRAAVVHDESPMPWLAATVERSQVYGPAHLVLARLLVRSSPSQARLEYRLAMEQMPESPWEAAREALAVVGGYWDAMEVVPEGKLGTNVLDFLVRSIDARLPATRVRLDAELSMRAPKEPGPALRAARDAVEDAEHSAETVWCAGPARAGCIAKALEKSAVAQRLEPERCEGYALKARARAASGEVLAALNDVEKAVESVNDRVTCLQQLATIATAVGAKERAWETLDRLASAGCSSHEECAQNLAWVASHEEALGNQRKALLLYKRAYESTPDDDALLENMARLASTIGLHNEAAEAFERLAQKHPEDLRWRRSGQEQRAAAMRTAIGL
jgi:tetratricopeptide (TPR) repeat protein